MPHHRRKSGEMNPSAGNDAHRAVLVTRGKEELNDSLDRDEIDCKGKYDNNHDWDVNSPLSPHCHPAVALLSPHCHPTEMTRGSRKVLTGMRPILK